MCNMQFKWQSEVKQVWVDREGVLVTGLLEYGQRGVDVCAVGCWYP